MKNEKIKELNKKDKKNGLQVGSGNLISQLFFLWLFRFIWIIKKTKDITTLGLFLRKSETSMYNDYLLDKNWKKEISQAAKQNRLPMIRRAIFKTFGSLFILNGIWKILWGIFLWFGAYWLLKQTIAYVRLYTKNLSALPANIAAGHGYALGFLFSSILASISIHQLISKSGCLGLRLKSALMVQIFKKSLVLSRLKGGAGDIVNLVSNDCQKIADACTNVQYLWSAMLELTAILVLSFVELSYSAVPALIIILLLIPIQIYLGYLKSVTGYENTMTTSKRVHIMSEILTAIKLIKFYAWETPFVKRISEIREKEMSLLKKNLLLNALNFMFVFCVPVLCALSCLLTYWLSGHTIEPVIGFTTVSVFNTLRYPLLMLPQAINSTSDAITALKRLDEFFSREEIEQAVRNPNADSDETVIVENATFKWDLKGEASQFILKNLNFIAKKKKITAIVGDVGSGKSSLLAALLGQMKHIEGKSKIYGSICYVPQEAWLLNMTFRENIIFGCEFNQEKYNKVIKVCALERDLSLMADGDQTEIGERGINLSGGQRQRISLARCVYKSSDVVLLDDPLSAVDQHVGKHIFNKCIKDYFKEKTVIFVTHQLQYLNQVDQIVVMQNGQIIEIGTYRQLMDNKGHLANLIAEHVEIDKDKVLEEDGDQNEQDLKEKLKESKENKNQIQLSPDQLLNRKRVSRLNSIQENDNNLTKFIENNVLKLVSDDKKGFKQDSIKVFERNRLASIVSQHDEEHIPVPTDAEPMKLVLEDQSIHYKEMPLKSYLKAGAGIFVTISIFVLFFLVHLVRILSDYWLSLWFAKSNGSYPDISDAVFVGAYAGATVLFTIGILTRGVLFSFNSIKKSLTLHKKMLESVIHARMAFFDSTPIGRILNAFARHQYAIDSQLAESLMQLLQYTPLCLGAMILCMSVMYPTCGVFGGGLIVTILILLYLGGVEAKFRNQEAITKSTIFSHLTASLEGLFSIRAYQCEKRFIEIYNSKIDENHKYLFGMMEVKCWIAFYLDILTSFMIYTVMIIVITFIGTFPAPVAGLVMSNVLQLLVFLQWAVRMAGETIEKLTSIRQVSFYGNAVPLEPPSIIDNNRPPKDWPPNGNIKFNSVFLKYQELGLPVLKGINLNIKPREKVGIVGRTGSGKSTILISLLRIVESCEGKIVIDDIDVSQIGLQDLRSKIAIIPQEPILFVGTIRENIDLFLKNSDDEVWNALNSVHLGDAIKKMELGLNAPVIENGKNFSVGQRQLLCIARAILSKTKIFVLDEATAAVDLQTDKLIQKTIKENFLNMTVLTIAHRLNTVMEADKILVMDAGKVVEFAPPVALLKLQNGYFTSLLSQTGKESFNKLKKIAEENAIKNGIDVQKLDIYADHDNIALDPVTGIDAVKKNFQNSHQKQPENHNQSKSGSINQGFNNDLVLEVNELIISSRI